jgi:DNA-binding IclR family transcriptional regulator
MVDMIQNLKRAVKVLQALNGEKNEYTLSEVVEQTGLPPSTVHRILNTLLSEDFVHADKRAHLYSLGPALISLGNGASRNANLNELARPILKELSELTGEDAILTVQVGNQGVILEKVDGASFIKVIEKHGRHFDLHCGASHRVLLAYQSEEFISNYIEAGLKKYSELTITEPDKLRENLKEIRDNGYGISYGEFMHGTLGIGSPVFNAQKSIVAAIGVVMPVVMSNAEKTESIIRQVKNYAEKLSTKLGYIPG